VTRLDRWLTSRAAPPAAGVIAAVLVWVTWGAVHPVPVMHDEWAYWTQAGQYAGNHWAMPAPPIPEFFEQLYVLVTPVFAAKYWPGHAMVLAPGFALGAPAAAPLLLSGIAGGLVFALARHVAGARVAAVTFVLWVGTFGNLRFRASYFSEVTTSCAWLIAWWALVRWRDTRRGTWMAALAVATGWGAITRPATMFVFALPVGAVVLHDAWRAGRWRQVALGVACGTAVLGILPLWSARVTGDWRVTPLAAYTRQYLPFDVPGYAKQAPPPERELPAEMERVRTFLAEIKDEQVATAPVVTFAARAGFLVRDGFAGWRLPFLLALAAGLAVGGQLAWFAFGSALLLVAGYVTQAHTRDWTVYYLEAFPVAAFAAALGVRAAARALPRSMRMPGWAPAALALAAAVLLARDAAVARATLAQVSARSRAFREAVTGLGDAPNIVFVRYARERNMHLALVANDGDLARARSWIVHDRGADNARLLAMAPGRTAFLFDEAAATFTRIAR
jgi:hypothetical protein